MLFRRIFIYQFRQYLEQCHIDGSTNKSHMQSYLSLIEAIMTPIWIFNFIGSTSQHYILNNKMILNLFLNYIKLNLINMSQIKNGNEKQNRRLQGRNRVIQECINFINTRDRYLLANNLNFTKRQKYQMQSNLSLFPFGIDTSTQEFYNTQPREQVIMAWVLRNFNIQLQDRINIQKFREAPRYVKDNPNDKKLQNEIILQQQQLQKKRRDCQIKQLERRRLRLSPNNLSALQSNAINIQNYQSFTTQTYQNWLQLKKYVDYLLDSLKSKDFYTKEYQQTSCDKVCRFCKVCQSRPKKINQYPYLPDSQYNIRGVLKAYLVLIQGWMQPPSTHPVRLICVNRNLQVNEGHLYIYRVQSYQSQDGEPLNQNTAQILRRKLIFSQYANRNYQRSQYAQNYYLRQSKNKLASRLMSPQNIGQFMIQDVMLQIDTLNNIQEGYIKANTNKLLQKWKQKAYYVKQNSHTFQYFQLRSIIIPRTMLANEITVNIDNKYNQKFRYVGQNQNSFIFTSESPNTIYDFNLDLRNNQYLPIKTTIKDKTNNYHYFSNMVGLSRYQNLNLGYVYQMGLIPNNKALLPDNLRGDFPYVLIMQTAVKKGTQFQKPSNLLDFRQANQFSRLGKIPNIYNSYYQTTYTPDMHSIISQILTGNPSPISQQNFWSTYIQYTTFFQKQDSKSQNYCQYLKIVGLRTNQVSGFVMSDRYQSYQKYIYENLNKVKNIYQQIISSSTRYQITKQFFKKDIRNIDEDIKFWKLPNTVRLSNIMKRFIMYHQLNGRLNVSNVNSNINNNSYYTMPNSSLMKIANLLFHIYHRNNLSRDYYINQISIFFITFIDILYPYHRNPSMLKEDLMHLRILVQKNIPQFNYFLNRKGIGLENFASTLFLQLFTGLPMQLCYRIWDFLIINIRNLQLARIAAVYTIMLFQQKSQLIPIYPINQIIQSIHINFNKIRLDSSSFFNLNKLVNNFNAQISKRQLSIVQLANQKYLNRFIYGKNIKLQQIFDEDDLEKMNKSTNVVPINDRLQAKLMSLKQISYPLPSPNFSGFPIQKICIFLSGVFLLGNINIHSKKYTLMISLLGRNESKQIPIKDKSFFENKFLQLNFYEISPNQRYVPILQFILKEEWSDGQGHRIEYIMSGKLRLEACHKDIVYRQNVVMQINKNLQKHALQMNNLGSSILNIAFVLKSASAKQYGDIIQDKYQHESEYLEKIFDFDMSAENNQVIKAMDRLDNLMKKVMDPLDQLDVQKYPRLKLTTTFRPRQSEWITNSKVSIEQFKAILGFIFSEQFQKPIRLNFFKYYESYAQKYQKLDLGRFLLQMILMAKISKVKKISMIFCLAAHYQNIFQLGANRKLSVQTVNSIIYQIIRSTGFINACPFKNDFFGQIKYACYYQKGSKVEQQKKQITQIVQDWAYICVIKSHYYGIIMGSVNDLSVLRAMIPINILRQIEKQALCRFQIQYKVKDQLYIWSATVNTSDFSIAKRGVKFLNNYPKYTQNNGYLTSIGDILYNCQNLISLEQHRGVQYQQFVKIFANSPLLNFLLTYNEYQTDKTPQKDRTSMVSYQIENINYNVVYLQKESNNSQSNIQQDQFTDFGIFRHQNSLPTWRKCKIINNLPQTLIKVAFKNKQGQYSVPRFQVITMDQASTTKEEQSNESTIYRH